MILIGYSGHAFVVHGILKATGKTVVGYCDKEEKTYNPFSLKYFGEEVSAYAMEHFPQLGFFIAIGDNVIRKKIYEHLAKREFYPWHAIHPSTIVDSSVVIAPYGVMMAAGVIVNPLAKIGIGTICNTGCIIEHECVVGDFAHIGPGAILCGNVKVGEQTFVGAGAVIRQGIQVGNNAIIGAGAVVVKDVPDNTTVMGIPAK